MAGYARNALANGHNLAPSTKIDTPFLFTVNDLIIDCYQNI